jgi:alpha/beta superfamily hydrolase
VKPPYTESLRLAGPAGALEALIETPATEAAATPATEAAATPAAEPASTPAAFGVICHPHPLYGGTMANKVVWTLARAFQQLGAPTIRFNFRGVGASEGSHDNGRGEVGDALAMVAYGRDRWPQAALWLAGFSFGGVIALHAAASAQPARAVLVAPGITRVELGDAAPPACPWLIVQGEADDVVPAAAVSAWARQLSPAPELVVLPGAGHYFHGRINELRDTVLDFMQRTSSAAAAS